MRVANVADRTVPFVQSVDALLDEYRWSERELMRQTQRMSGWGTTATISHLMNGSLAPSMEAMERIAVALNVAPMIWPEYRMAVLRRDLNPVKVGFEAAMKKLAEIEEAV